MLRWNGCMYAEPKERDRDSIEWVSEWVSEWEEKRKRIKWILEIYMIGLIHSHFTPTILHRYLFELHSHPIHFTQSWQFPYFAPHRRVGNQCEWSCTNGVQSMRLFVVGVYFFFLFLFHFVNATDTDGFVGSYVRVWRIWNKRFPVSRSLLSHSIFGQHLCTLFLLAADGFDFNRFLLDESQIQ